MSDFASSPAENVAPEEQGVPLPAAELVMRLLKTTANGAALPSAFEPSSADEASSLKGVSVFAESRTTSAQAQTFLSSDYLFYARLLVEEVRALRPEPDAVPVPALDVVWDRLFVVTVGGQETLDTRPGAHGHAGIVGLVRPPGMPRLHYKSLRAQLVQMANRNGLRSL